MPGTNRGGPKHSQWDSRGALWGDPTGLSVMQGNSETPLPPKIAPLLQFHAAASIQWHKPPSLSLSCYLVRARTAWMLGYFTTSPGPGKAWPSISIPGTEHPRLLGPGAVFAALPTGAASQHPESEFASEVPIFTITRETNKKELKRHKPPRHLPTHQALF